MVEISGSRFEPVADVTQGDAVRELTKHHAYQMTIRIKAFRVFVGIMFRKYPFENIFWKMLYYLCEKSYICHWKFVCFFALLR